MMVDQELYERFEGALNIAGRAGRRRRSERRHSMSKKLSMRRLAQT